MELKKHIYIFFLFSCFVVKGQELMRSSISASGASETVTVGESIYTIQQSVGQQSVIGSFTTENVTARQGFIQPPIKINGIVEEDTNLDAVVYPNPFESSVHIKFNEEIKGQLSVVLYDLQGRLVYDKPYDAAPEIVVNLDFLSKAAYVLLVSTENKQFKANLLKN